MAQTTFPHRVLAVCLALHKALPSRARRLAVATRQRVARRPVGLRAAATAALSVRAVDDSEQGQQIEQMGRE